MYQTFDSFVDYDSAKKPFETITFSLRISGVSPKLQKIYLFVCLFHILYNYVKLYCAYFCLYVYARPARHHAPVSRTDPGTTHTQTRAHTHTQLNNGFTMSLNF